MCFRGTGEPSAAAAGLGQRASSTVKTVNLGRVSTVKEGLWREKRGFERRGITSGAGKRVACYAVLAHFVHAEPVSYRGRDLHFDI